MKRRTHTLFRVLPVMLVIGGLLLWLNWDRLNGKVLSCQPDCAGQTLDGRQLQATNLSGVKFSQANLRRVNFTQANLRGADLSGADLREAVLNGADLRAANLTGADLSQAHLVGALLDGANLSAANLNEATLTGVDLSGVILGGATLAKARLVAANLAGTKLSGANLQEANFTGANLSEADLSGSNLAGATLVGADLTYADLKGASGTNANFNGSRLSWADFGGVNFGEAAVLLLEDKAPGTGNGTYLSGVDGRGAYFDGASLVGCDLSGSNFDGAHFENADLTYCTPNGAVFSGASLQGVRFYDPYIDEDLRYPADLFGVSFARADLQGAYFAGVIARGVNFRGANLTGAIFSENIVDANGQETELTTTLAGILTDFTTIWPDVRVAAQTSIPLRLFSWRGADVAAMERLLAQFHAEHPNIIVAYETSATPGEYDNALKNILETRDATYDLVYLRSFSSAQSYYEQGLLESLAPLAALQTQFAAEARVPWMDNTGVSYGVPFIATSHAIYYNQDMFARLKLEPPQTWEQLLAVALTLKANDITPFANGSAETWTVNEVMFMSLAPNFIGGRAGRLDYLAGRRCFNDAQAVAAFQALADLRLYLPANYAEVDYQTSQELFATGQAAMLWDGSWSIQDIERQRPSFNWSVFAPPPPAGHTPQITFHLDAGIGLNAASKKKEPAQVFLTWLTTPTATQMLANELPGFYPLANDVPQITNPVAQAFLALNEGRSTDVRWAWPGLRNGTPDAYTLMLTGSVGVINGTLTPQEAADQLQAGLAEWFEPAQQCVAEP